MGRRGPAPTPKAILEARGSWRAGLAAGEPKGKAGLPKPPRWLGKEARDLWRQLGKVVPAGVVTQDNGNALARYCDALARWLRLKAWLDEHDDTYYATDERGNTKSYTHPKAALYLKLSVALLRLEQEFGLTPAARTRISVQASEEKPAKPAQSGPPQLLIAE